MIGNRPLKVLSGPETNSSGAMAAPKLAPHPPLGARLSKAEQRMRRHMAKDRQFVNSTVDPVLGRLLERVYVAQPDQLIPFMLREIRGELPHPADRKPARRQPIGGGAPGHAKARVAKKSYMARRVTPVMHKLMKKMLVARPRDVRAFVEDALLEIGGEEEEEEEERRRRLPACGGNQGGNREAVADRGARTQGVGRLSSEEGRRQPNLVAPAAAVVVGGGGGAGMRGSCNGGGGGAAMSSARSRIALAQEMDVQVAIQSGQAEAQIVAVQMPASPVVPTKPRTLTVLVVGIDNAGKTSLLNTLQGKFAKEPKSSQGFEQVSMQLDEQTKVNMYDLAGNAKMRDIWVNYYGDVHGVIFMVDAADATRMEESARTFKQIMSHKRLSNKPVLLVGNKQDVAGAATGEALRETFGVGALPNVVVGCFSAKADSETAVDERLEPALESLLGVCKERYEELEQRVAADLASFKQEQEKKKREQKERVLKRVMEKAFPESGDPVECWDEADGLQALSEEMLLSSVDELPPLAKEAAAFCRYQKMVLQMVGAMAVPVSKKTTPLTWEQIMEVLARIKQAIADGRLKMGELAGAAMV